KNLAYCACVNHPTGVVDPLQRGERRSGKAELRVVVILENKCVVSTREIEDGRPALKAHCNAERKLVRGRYVNNPRCRFFWRSRDHDSLVVDRLWDCFYS